jgi:hypothetical protein
MLRTKVIILIIALGFVVIVAGFFYGAIFVGVPYQDPSPELLARQNFNDSVASYIYMSGFGMIILGVVLSITRVVTRHSIEKKRSVISRQSDKEGSWNK